MLAASQGTERMQEIAQAVQEGAAAYLRRQFRTLGVFVVVIFFVLLLLPADGSGVRWGRSIFFLVGALFSGLTGFTGMSLAVRGNVRVAAAARAGFGGERPAMRIAFRTGGVAGMFTVGLGLFGAALVVFIYRENAPNVLEGFGFGAALLAMFMRVGGGIFTKAADVGADLVGKVEKGIPEDDPRNAATIADNVGDNVGDCAGMAADLFESYAVMLVASLILGKAAFGNDGLVFPLIVPMIGVITAVAGIFVVAAAQERPQRHDRDQPRLLHLRDHLAGAGRRRRRSSTCRPSSASSRASRARARTRSCTTAATRGWLAIGAVAHRAGAGQRHPAADRVLHRDQPQAGHGDRRELADRRGHGDPVRHLGRPGVGGLLGAADRRGGLRARSCSARATPPSPCSRWRWPAPAC